MQLSSDRVLPCCHPRPTSVRRIALAAAGLTCFGLGAVGVVVPGMPTTVFVLMGSFCLTKSCPWLERRLVESRLFRPYAKYLDPTMPMPRRAKVLAIGSMWTAIIISSVLIALAGAPWFVPALVVAMGIVGTWVIARFRRHLSVPRQDAAHPARFETTHADMQHEPAEAVCVCICTTPTSKSTLQNARSE
ncbi:MAG: YbaN family protein [Phycisphaeraceae bacterium]|nr:YbaN family protein [Phycisphaeraceae bacterium]MCW5754977.1 YbaN family protein [Phycisphaeraceae bacterium]